VLAAIAITFASWLMVCLFSTGAPLPRKTTVCMLSEVLGVWETSASIPCGISETVPKVVRPPPAPAEKLSDAANPGKENTARREKCTNAESSAHTTTVVYAY
jgi:hypothetical protein